MKALYFFSSVILVIYGFGLSLAQLVYTNDLPLENMISLLLIFIFSLTSFILIVAFSVRYERNIFSNIAVLLPYITIVLMVTQANGRFGLYAFTAIPILTGLLLLVAFVIRIPRLQ